jgi:hypothetical protein
MAKFKRVLAQTLAIVEGTVNDYHRQPQKSLSMGAKARMSARSITRFAVTIGAGSRRLSVKSEFV